jgi:hypothetical protein
MRNMLFLFCVLGISCGAVAQNSQASWASLSGLRAGQSIQVVEANSKTHSGVFESVSDSAISLKDATGEASFPKQDVRSVKLINSRRLRNTLIGLGVGAGAGAGIGAAAWESRGFLHGKGTGAAVCAGLGGITGLIIGVALPNHETIYKASAH